MKKVNPRSVAMIVMALFAVLATAPVASASTTPNIQVQSCSGRPTWVKVSNPGGPFCVGFTGTQNFSNVDMTGFCAGNNSGTVRFIEQGVATHLDFTPGKSYDFLPENGVALTSITITGWSGGATC